MFFFIPPEQEMCGQRFGREFTQKSGTLCPVRLAASSLPSVLSFILTGGDLQLPVFMRVADVSGTGSGGDGWQASKSPSANCQPLSCALLLLLIRIFRPSLLLLQLRLKVPIVAVVKRRQMMNECKFAAVRCLLIWNWKAKHVIIKVFLF